MTHGAGKATSELGATRATELGLDEAGAGEVPFTDAGSLDSLRRAIAEWRDKDVASATHQQPLRKDRFVTWSGIEVPDLLTPADVRLDYERDLGLPGRYPFTRGVQPTLYRGRLWTMRMVAGFGTAAETNRRFRYLVEQGQTGLSTAFEFPT